MFRWNILTTCAFALLLPFLRPGAASAEDPPEVEREMAKARFAADQASPAELRLQRLEAVRSWHLVQDDKYTAGTVTPDSYLDSSLFLLQVELLAQGRPSPGPLLEQVWRQAWHASDLAEWKYQAGRGTTSDVGQTRAARLTVEIELARLREKNPSK